MRGAGRVDGPGLVVRTAKNEPTGPGFRNQPGTDRKGSTPMVGNVGDLCVCALRELRAARDRMGLWTDEIRRAAGERVGSDDLDAVLEDRAYWDAIGLYRQLNDVIATFAREAAAIEAGERR